jgi:hypothetical protein
MNTNIADLFAGIPGLKADYKVDWIEDAKADWRLDWDATAGMPSVNTVLPVISGTAQDTMVLGVSDGTWSGTPSFTYQWYVAGIAVPGATTNSYTVVTSNVGKLVSCKVVATNANGPAAANAVAVGPVIA